MTIKSKIKNSIDYTKQFKESAEPSLNVLDKSGPIC